MSQRYEAEFTSFVALHWSSLLRSTTLLTGSPAAAEDLLQTSLAKLWVSWRKARTGSPEAYLRRVIATTHVSLWRRLRDREHPTEDVPEIGIGDTTNAVDDRLGLEAALRRLTPRQRAVVVLRHFDDLTEQQTANALECSVGTVKTLNSRALARLREFQELQRWRGAEPPPTPAEEKR